MKHPEPAEENDEGGQDPHRVVVPVKKGKAAPSATSTILNKKLEKSNIEETNRKLGFSYFT
jgi:hypothetical protein